MRGQQPAARGPDLDELLSSLPQSQREVIVMLKVSGMSMEEVARATSSSVVSYRYSGCSTTTRTRPSGKAFTCSGENVKRR